MQYIYIKLGVFQLGLSRPEIWPNPAQYYAFCILTEKLVKNGPNYVKISGPSPTQAQNGRLEPKPEKEVT